MSEWISVKDRLPETSEDMLVIMRAGDASWYEVSSHYSWGWECEGDVGTTVTHWMPLPEPPKEEKVP